MQHKRHAPKPKGLHDASAYSHCEQLLIYGMSCSCHAHQFLTLPSRVQSRRNSNHPLQQAKQRHYIHLGCKTWVSHPTWPHKHTSTSQSVRLCPSHLSCGELGRNSPLSAEGRQGRLNVELFVRHTEPQVPAVRPTHAFLWWKNPLEWARKTVWFLQ